MLIYSMSLSVDGFIADRAGGFGWSAPSEELFRCQLVRATPRYARVLTRVTGERELSEACTRESV